MSKNMTELASKYEELIHMADKIQSREMLSPASLQLLAGLLARISMLELELYGEAGIYGRNRRNENPKAPF